MNKRKNELKEKEKSGEREERMKREWTESVFGYCMMGHEMGRTRASAIKGWEPLL